MEVLTEELFALQPDEVTNPVGVASREALKSRLRHAVAEGGAHRATFTGGAMDFRSFADVFFPERARFGNQDAVPDIGVRIEGIEVGTPGWTVYASSVICEGILAVTQKAREKLAPELVTQWLQSCAEAAAPRLVSVYATMLPRAHPRTGEVLARLQRLGALEAARSRYAQALLSDNWTTFKIKQMTPPNRWEGAAWEMFHHWVKLNALGLAHFEIDALADRVKARLNYPSEVGSAAWRVFARAPLNQPLRFQDFEGELTLGLKAEGMFSFGGQATPDPERWSQAFVAQQGGRFQRPRPTPPPSSCFGGESRVRMADGTTLPIRDVRPGDRVDTPAGPRTVRVVASVARARRPFFRIDGLDFRFSGSHPFAAHPGAPDAPGFLAVLPEAARLAVPTLVRHGVGPLAPGCALQAREAHGLVPWRVQHLVPEPSGDASEPVFDLILDFEREGCPGYFIGTAERQFLVQPEFPELAPWPRATTALTHALATVLARLEVLPEDTVLEAAAPELMEDLVPKALARLAHAPAEAPAALPEEPLEAAAALASLLHAEGPYERRLGQLVQSLVGYLMADLETALALFWRAVPARAEPAPEVLAVTLGALWGARGLPGSVALEVALPGAPFVPVTPASSRAATAFFQPLDRVLYAPWPRGEGAPVLRVRDGRGATAELPLSAGPTRLRRADVPLRSGDGRTVATLSLDVRGLSTTDAGAEQLRATVSSGPAPAVALGSALGAVLAERLARLAAHLLSSSLHPHARSSTHENA
ncbi:hypothetical protein D187_000775 [Cystobacter fuscus DSM 2262]|uniref:Vint domain-containing protein n=1 Tax=Cystobacter fuscus (strain ATCC 25194 / DSM 2262 / NBRC 100088 / M29) TaxID=1242864 RepID=S9QVF6_CYSF2|nr:hypothetical protein D187_000775 [Cystobacter fuscus DSM 2262]